MNDRDDLDGWIRRVVAAAGSDAPTQAPLQPAAAGTVFRRRWPVATAAAGIVALFGAGAITWAFVGSEDGTSTNPPGTFEAPATAPTTSAEPVLTTTTPSSTGTPTSTVTAEPELVRPILDLDGCRPTWASRRDGVVIEGAYVWAKSTGLPLQVFVPPGGSVAGEFAVAVRVFTNQRFDPANANTEVNGQPAHATFLEPRWGDLMWRLPDGSDAYLRTSTMSQDELIALAATLVARPGDATIPAFDTEDGTYVLVDEAITPFTIDTITDSACELATGGWLRASIIDSRPLGQALFLTDRSSGPAAIRSLDDGRLLVVTGRQDVADRSDDALAAVREANADEWAQLTRADPTDYEPNHPLAPPSTGG
jgi:hypothetical protein